MRGAEICKVDRRLAYNNAMHYGAWFRQQREKRGWSQAWVARRIGVSRGQMNNIEGGRSRASAEALQALCALFETTPAQMLADMESKQETASEGTVAKVVHPGVEELSKDRKLMETCGITDAMIAAARTLFLVGADGKPITITTVAEALDYLRVMQRHWPPDAGRA